MNPRPKRAAGILLHPTSLPGPYGIGDIGPAAHAWIDVLARARQSWWQMLPLGPTGYGDSPYQCFSAFAGNPMFISMVRLLNEGLLEARDLEDLPQFCVDEVEYERVNQFKLPRLSRAFQEFKRAAPSERMARFEEFKAAECSWLSDYALFVALKDKFGGVAWPRWDREFVRRDASALQRAREALTEQIEEHEFLQFVFFEQWEELKSYCREKNIRVMGDLPIYVAHDSADVWAHPETFHLDEHGNAK